MMSEHEGKITKLVMLVVVTADVMLSSRGICVSDIGTVRPYVTCAAAEEAPHPHDHREVISRRADGTQTPILSSGQQFTGAAYGPRRS
jgi:hypothetical protein